MKVKELRQQIENDLNEKFVGLRVNEDLIIEALWSHPIYCALFPHREHPEKNGIFGWGFAEDTYWENDEEHGVVEKIVVLGCSDIDNINVFFGDDQ